MFYKLMTVLLNKYIYILYGLLIVFQDCKQCYDVAKVTNQFYKHAMRTWQPLEGGIV